jgi:hypothetical protein
MLLRLAHTSPLLFEFRSTKLVQNLPGTPFRVGRRLESSILVSRSKARECFRERDGAGLPPNSHRHHV